MKLNTTFLLLLLSTGALSIHAATPESASGTTTYEETQTVTTKESSVDRESLEKDNTGRNKNQDVTAESQMKSTEADTEITRKLRERLVADDQLSTNAHNIKIITSKDSIILKGPVANRSEKVKIENMTRTMAGKKKVYNRLTY